MNTDLPEPASVVPEMAQLYRKKALVMATLERLPKAGYNEQQHYPYVTASDVKDAVRQAMSEAGLSLHMTTLHVERMATDKGTRTIVDYAISICDSETGAMETSHWQGIGTDYGNDDKGFNKASTQAVKYFLLTTFLGSSFEEDRHDSDKDSASRSAAQQRQRTPRQPAVSGNGDSKKKDGFIVPAWWNPVMSVVLRTEYAGNQQHATNSIKKLLADGKIQANWTAQQVIEAIQAHHAQPEAEPFPE